MTKKEAKRQVCKCAAALLDPRAGHENGFLYEDEDGHEYSEADNQRLRDALVELCEELERRGGPSHG